MMEDDIMHRRPCALFSVGVINGISLFDSVTHQMTHRAVRGGCAGYFSDFSQEQHHVIKV